jgi:FkbM family methyltransferase
MRWRRAIYHALNRPGVRQAFAVALSMRATAQTRKICRVSYQRAWVQRWPDGVFVEPKPSLMPLSTVRELALDRWMFKYIPRAGDVVVDVGAGAGGETVFFSQLVGATGRVIAIEAHPHTFFCLQETCRRNRLRNVSPIDCAVTSGECLVLLTNDEEYSVNRIVQGETGVAVRGLELDKIPEVLNLPHIDLLKVNIEGSEGNAMAGMALTIQKARNVCIACHDFLAIGEKSGWPGFCTKKLVTEFLVRNGFDIQIRDQDSRAEVRDYVYGANRNLIV